jgi:hypothetical protein
VTGGNTHSSSATRQVRTLDGSACLRRDTKTPVIYISRAEYYAINKNTDELVASYLQDGRIAAK